jgi:hypothetical protein
MSAGDRVRPNRVCKELGISVRKKSTVITSTIFMVLTLSFSGPAVAGATPGSGKIELPKEDQTQSISKPVLEKFASAKPWTAERMKKAIPADEPETSAAVPLSLAEAQDNVSKDKKGYQGDRTSCSANET